MTDQEELVQRLARIESSCEGRCASAIEMRGEMKEELREIRKDMKRLEEKFYARIEGIANGLSADIKANREAIFWMKIKIATLSGGIGAALTWGIEKLIGK